jgi:hypothetical protein
VVTLTGGPDNKTYTGTTSATGVVDIVVPPTTSANPYTVVVSKSSGTIYSAQVGPVTTVASGVTTPVAVSLKTWTITVQRNGTNFANNGVNVSVTGGPFGTQDANPAYTTSGTTNGSAQITTTLPAGSGTFKFKVWRSSCSVSGSKSGSNTAAATGSTVTVNMTSSTCPPSTP